MKKILLLTFIVTSAFANTALDWQKVSLEEKLSNKVKISLGKILDSNQYLVETDVKFNDPGPPNFDDMNKIGLKISDIEFDDSKGDYIAFSKVGLEVPVIEKFNQDNQQKLKELHRYNEAYNLFKNLDSVEIKVYLSDLLDETKLNQAKAVINNLKFSTGEVKPKVSFDKISLELVKAVANPKKDSMTLKEILSWLAEFGNAFGLIMATILFGVFAKKILRLWEEIMNNMKAKEEEVAENEEEKSEEDELSAALDNAQDGLYAELESEDFERFRKFFEKSKQDTILMLKRWISVYDDKFKVALKAVAQQLKDDELMEIFSGLNNTEREKWKNSLDEFMDLEKIKETNKFISEEVVRSMIGPSQVQDVELIDTLLSLSDEVACAFVEQKPEESKILMNLLTPQFSGSILDQLPEEKAQEVIVNSLSFDFSQITDNFAAFKVTLKDFAEGMKRKPFNDKLVQMLPDFNPLKEVMLYEFLAVSGMKSEMNMMAKENFPSELVSNLPAAFLKKNLQEYDKNARVLLLASLVGEQKERMTNAFAEEGSASREMLDLEFEEIQNNQIAQAKIANKKDDIWKEFVIHTRAAIRADQEYSSDIELIIGDWVEKLIGEKAAA